MLMEIPKTPIVSVKTTQNKGFSSEEIAERCVNKIIAVSENAPVEIQEQALAYKKQLFHVICFYLKEAINSDRTTVYNIIKQAGHEKLAEHIRSM